MLVHSSGQNSPLTAISKNKCFSCRNDFDTFGDMMEHRKNVHPETVKDSTKAITGDRRRKTCWFLHPTENTQQGFQAVRQVQVVP